MNHYAEPSLERQAASSSGAGCLLLLFPPLIVALLGFLTFGQVDIAKTAPLPTPTPTAILTQEVKEETTEVKQTAPSGQLARLFTPEVLYWEEEILKWSEQYKLNPNLVATVMQIESCGDKQARSGAGAMGLFQVMPYHFAAGENGYHPGTNAKRGLQYLRAAQEKGGSARMAFAGYNGGITGAAQGEAYWPAETKRYVYWGVGIYNAAKAGDTTSVRLNEWLAAGGASLCAQAARRQGSQ
ncbi:MAG: transglycosylase SLT domain-containing protein [Chloroflexota bacterium]|nr:transglycosylase SLT domain-containing protein [Chloroflexota bacterium]